MPTPTEPQTFVLADRALQRTVDQIADEQWTMVVPDWVPMSSRHKGTGMTLRMLVNYHAYDDAWVPAMLSGATMDEEGRERFDGDLIGDDPSGSFGAIVDAACAAAEGFDDLEMTVHLSFGDFTAQHYFWQINQFRALRARDIARMIGVDETLPDDLLQGIWDELAPNVETWRKIGVFGPAVDVPETASLQDRLMGLTGRQP